MLFILLIVLILFMFGGLMFFLWYVLKRNYSNATVRLQALSKDIVSKEEEAKRVLLNAQKEAKGILVKETQTAQETREQIIKEAQEQKDRILEEANSKGEDISEKAQRNAEFIQKELDQKIDERAKEKVSELIQKSIPEDFLQEVHKRWVNSSGDNTFDLKLLKLPDDVKEAKVISAFKLTEDQLQELKTKLKKKVGNDVPIKAEVDASLLAGMMIKIGHVVVDVSLKYKIQKAMQK